MRMLDKGPAALWGAWKWASLKNTHIQNTCLSVFERENTQELFPTCSNSPNLFNKKCGFHLMGVANLTQH